MIICGQIWRRGRAVPYKRIQSKKNGEVHGVRSSPDQQSSDEQASHFNTYMELKPWPSNQESQVSFWVKTWEPRILQYGASERKWHEIWYFQNCFCICFVQIIHPFFYIISLTIYVFWFVLTYMYDLMEDRCRGDVAIRNILLLYCVKQLDSVVSSVTKELKILWELQCNSRLKFVRHCFVLTAFWRHL